MQVVLLKDIENLGEVSEVLKVSDGYARNYLIPRKLAVEASPAALKRAENSRKKREQELEAKREHFQEMADKLGGLLLEIKADAGEGGKLFGSVTSADIVEAIGQQAGINISKKNLILLQPIKSLGEHEVSFKLLKGIEGKIKIKVEAAKG